jgi:hypothetical protein
MDIKNCALPAIEKRVGLACACLLLKFQIGTLAKRICFWVAQRF